MKGCGLYGCKVDVGDELEFVVCMVCLYGVFEVCMVDIVADIDEVDHSDQVVS